MPKALRKPSQELSDVDFLTLVYVLGGLAALNLVVPLSLRLGYPQSLDLPAVAPPALQFHQPKLELDPGKSFGEQIAAQGVRLEHTGVNPENPVTFHIPIDRAIDLIAKRGLPGWPRQ